MDLLKKSFALSLGLLVESKEQIEKMVDELVKKGELSVSESKDLINELVAKGETHQKDLTSKIQEQLQKLLTELNLPSRADIDRLEKKIANLENQLGNVQVHTPGSE